MKSLKISATLTLPLTYATKTAAILAQRRKGKTYTASVLAEEMVAAKQPFVALDPTGAWWGLRASADGAAAGLPVVILGGQHGDVALERTGGRLVADLVVDEPGYYVIDFSLFESGEAERQFAVDFAERLYRAKAQPGKNFPLHLFVDEADRFIPQNLTNKSETSPRLLGAFEAIVRRGGLRGLGTTLISQRAAVVNKNVLEMLDVLLVLRTLGPNDQKAIRGYVAAHGSEAELTAIMGSLASLAIGEAWVWEPGAEPSLFERVQIRKRHTFNSSATPDTAHRPVEPKQLAKVDLEALTKRMHETIQRAKADDPRELRKLLADKDRQLKELERTSSKHDRNIRGSIPILTDSDRTLLKEFAEKLQIAAAAMANSSLVFDEEGFAQRLAAELRKAAAEARQEQVGYRDEVLRLLDGKRISKVIEKLQGLSLEPNVIKALQTKPVILKQSVVSRPIRQVNGTAVTGDASLRRGAFRSMLVALAQAGRPLRDNQVAARVGMALSGTFDKYLGQQRTSGWVEGQRTALTITDAGLAALGGYEPLPTGIDLQRYWLDYVGAGKKREMLQVLIAAYPRTLSDEDVAAKADMALSGTFDKYLGQLRTLQLVAGSRQSLVASEELF